MLTASNFWCVNGSYTANCILHHEVNATKTVHKWLHWRFTKPVKINGLYMDRKWAITAFNQFAYPFK